MDLKARLRDPNMLVLGQQQYVRECIFGDDVKEFTPILQKLRFMHSATTSKPPLALLTLLHLHIHDPSNHPMTSEQRGVIVSHAQQCKECRILLQVIW